MAEKKKTEKKETKKTTVKKTNVKSQKASNKSAEAKTKKTNKAPKVLKEEKKGQEKKKVKKIDTYKVKKEKKNGKFKTWFNNLTLEQIVIGGVIIIAILLLVLIGVSTKNTKTTNGDDIVVKVDGKTITADDLYKTLKKQNGQSVAINLIDEYILNKEYKTTDEMKDANTPVYNTVGSWVVTLNKDKKGNLKNTSQMYIPYYQTIRDDYKTFKTLHLTDHESIYLSQPTIRDEKDKIYSGIKNGESVDGVCSRLGISPLKFGGMLEEFKLKGYDIDKPRNLAKSVTVE